jgi:hypothetical protein
MICPAGNYPVEVRSALRRRELIRLSWSARELGLRLGLGDLQDSEICHGYANACVCSECVEREDGPKRVERLRQPWESAA